MIAEPPFVVGGVQLTVTEPLPWMPVTLVGFPGAVDGVTSDEAVEAVPDIANPLGGTAISPGTSGSGVSVAMQPLLSQLSLQQLTAINAAPLQTQPLVAQLMVLQAQPVAALGYLKASPEPSDALLYKVLSHPEAIAEQREALSARIGPENFSKLAATANELNKLAGQNSTVREMLASGVNPAAALKSGSRPGN